LILPLLLHGTDGSRHAQVPITRLTIAGWTGRDPVAVQAHIDELAALGVAPPPRVPVYYRASASRLTQAPVIQVTGARTSGEAEFVLLRHEGRVWVLAGSDHTDRVVETYDVTVSKQMCDKPISAEAWELTTVAAHWDELRLSAWADGRLYQDGPVSGLLDPGALLAGAGPIYEGSALFGGTISVHGTIGPANRFSVRISDPIMKRDLTLSYQTEVLGL